MTGMKDSTIRSVLKKKIEGWLKTVDEDIQDKIRENLIITGGAIPSMVMGEEVNDYDFYFKNRETALLVANYYVKEFNEKGGFLKKNFNVNYKPFVKEEERINLKGEVEKRILIYLKSAGVAGETQEDYQYFEDKPEAAADDFMEKLMVEQTEEIMEQAKKPYRPIFLSENAITLSGKIQLIIRFYGDPKEIHKNFDFQHAMCWYDVNKDELIIPEASMRCMLSKTLIYNGSLYPLASLFRIRKFMERNWRITAGQLLKIAYQISDTDLSDRNILREQLIGVDQAYMTQLLNELESHKGKIDTTYLAKLIDKIFDGD